MVKIALPADHLYKQHIPKKESRPMDFTSKEQEYLAKIKELGESGSPELSALCRRAWEDSQTGEISQNSLQ